MALFFSTLNGRGFGLDPVYAQVFEGVRKLREVFGNKGSEVLSLLPLMGLGYQEKDGGF